MKLFNTLTRRVEELKPIKDNKVGLYTCGPTVYNHMHIGNIGSFIYADTLRRTAKSSGCAVEHVMNFTDVDDKTIRRSRENYPGLEPGAALTKLTEEYGKIALQDMEAVNIDTKGIKIVKATDNIRAMQDLVRELLMGGFAYLAEDGVYFSIAAYRKSGKKYGQLTEITASSTSEARIDNDEYGKESAHDFALWKREKPGEPAWDFEIEGQNIKGRPGWHIECSVMSTVNLGQPFDIHTGGVDLIFPHHENEIAQSTAAKDKAYASAFVHNEHMLVDGKKMSKSLGNFYTLEDIKQKGFDPLAFRLLVLQAHYRSQAHFSWGNLDAARNRLQSLRAMAVLRWQAKDNLNDQGTFTFEDVPAELAKIMSDDLNTPAALAYLSEVVAQTEAVLVRVDSLDHFENMLKGMDALLGLGLSNIPDITETQKQSIGERQAARESKNWRKSDELRDKLKEQGIGLRDTPYGPIWYPL